ncbi:hypothetical protein HOY82DRAFT_598946 [Tuber indicum]|nr:hypothetical protein HOY82DRAFT_598946 [Tuber indicum]
MAQDQEINSKAIKDGPQCQVHVLTGVEIRDENRIEADARFKLQTAIKEEEFMITEKEVNTFRLNDHGREDLGPNLSL